MNDQLSNEEMIELQKFLSAEAPSSQEKHTVHSFLHKVATSEDTTKTANLSVEELGMPKLPVRTHKELAVFCKDVADMDYFSGYFDKMSEITNATSLSKEAKLLNLAVITRRQLEDVTRRPRAKRGLFKRKDEEEGGEVT